MGSEMCIRDSIDGVIARFFTPEFVANNSIELKRVRNVALSHAAHGYAGCCAAIRDMELYPRLANIQAAALVVVGDFDQSTPLARGQALVDRIQGARLASVPSAHIPTTEIPDSYVKAVLPFLKA